MINIILRSIIFKHNTLIFVDNDKHNTSEECLLILLIYSEEIC
jgi:hypothetical protein